MSTIIGLIFIIILVWILIHAYHKKNTAEQGRWYWHYTERFFHFSGVKYIWRKFSPEKNEEVPTGWIWLISLYFAAFAFTTQRYENRLDTVEMRFNIFVSQIAADVPFDNNQLMSILNLTLPIKPELFKIKSVFSSISYPFIKKMYHQVVKDAEGDVFRNAAVVQKEFIHRWLHKLNKADFRNAQINTIKFRDAKLELANFEDSYLKEPDFSGANLKGANFSGAHLEDPSFIGAKLSDAHFVATHINYTTFAESNLSRTSFHGMSLKNANFIRAVLHDTIFSDVDLSETNFTEAELKNTKFHSWVNLSNTNFYDADLSNINASRQSLYRSDFQQAELIEIDFSWARLNNALFRFAKLENINFTHANLLKADFSYSTLQNVNFEMSQLQGAIFAGVDLKKINFNGANLQGSNFEESKFLTAEQLIKASNIKGIVNYSQDVLKDIENYGCEVMVRYEPHQWDDSFRAHRQNLLREWEK